MKYLLLIICFLLLAGENSNAQIDLNKVLKSQKKKTETKIENRIEEKIDNEVDEALNETEKQIEDTSSEQKENKNKSKEKSEQKNDTENNAGEEIPITNVEKTAPQEKPQLSWSQFDFVPGTEIIFEDNQEGEQNGEFPSKWDLVQGNFENASFDGANVIYHIKCNMNGGGGIVPMLKNAKEDYLPEEFTIEFDAYFSEDHDGHYCIYLGDYKNQKKLDKEHPINKKRIRIYKNSVDCNDIDQNYYPGYNSSVFDKTLKWRHVSISFNKRALKVYLDDARILNIPNLGYNPTGFSIGKQNVSGKKAGYTKNFRIAKGAVPLYDKLITDGKIVTTGIRFDVNKATIKSESMGVINEIVKLMKDKPEINFSVEGHTDNDGDDASNLKLSEARAKAVMDKMIESGISASRLKSKGLGESKPISDNTTSEGKANNRRVEFVKF